MGRRRCGAGAPPLDNPTSHRGCHGAWRDRSVVVAFQKKQTRPIIAGLFHGKNVGAFHQVFRENVLMTPNLAPALQPLTGLYEPSAIQQFPDGRFLVVEDEKDHAFSRLTLSASGDVSQKSLCPGWFHGGDPIWKLDDLEGLTRDGLGHPYTITSHSRKSQRLTP